MLLTVKSAGTEESALVESVADIPIIELAFGAGGWITEDWKNVMLSVADEVYDQVKTEWKDVYTHWHIVRPSPFGVSCPVAVRRNLAWQREECIL